MLILRIFYSFAPLLRARRRQAETSLSPRPTTFRDPSTSRRCKASLAPLRMTTGGRKHHFAAGNTSLCGLAALHHFAVGNTSHYLKTLQRKKYVILTGDRSARKRGRWPLFSEVGRKPMGTAGRAEGPLNGKACGREKKLATPSNVPRSFDSVTLFPRSG